MSDCESVFVYVYVNGGPKLSANITDVFGVLIVTDYMGYCFEFKLSRNSPPIFVMLRKHCDVNDSGRE